MDIQQKIASFDLQAFFFDQGVPFLVKLLIAIAIFVIGRFVAKRVANYAAGAMRKSKLDEFAVRFISNTLNTVISIFVILYALDHLGINTTGLAAIIGAAGLAIGLALKDSLGHFAAGVMLVFFRPFQLGDFVEIGGQSGSVDAITMFSTRLKTGDNKIVTIPNGNVFSTTLVNYSSESTRRIDLVIGIGYGSDLKKAKQLLEDILAANDKILATPASTVAVAELADSSVNFVVRPWVNAGDYWPTRFELLETIKLTFDQEGIEIPFPQMDVHVSNA